MCEFCGRIIGHEYRCPNYILPKAKHYCSFCGEGIYDGEEYIMNQDNEYRHYDCFYGTKDMMEWLGAEIKIMDSE